MDLPKACTEYATQLFTYPPNTIVDFVVGTLDAAVTECLEPLEKSLLTCSGLEDVPKEELRKGMDKLKLRYQQKMEPISNKVQRFLLEFIFKIPDHVLLPEDVAQRTKYSTKGHRKMLKEIENIKMEIKAEKYKKAVFQGKLKEATETLENFKVTAKEMESTTQQVFRENKIVDLQENAEFISKKVEACKVQLRDLRELIPQPETLKDQNQVFRQNEQQLVKRIKLRN